MEREIFFTLDALSHTRRFCIYYPARSVTADETPLGMVIYLHPFAEEMNKSRPMAAKQARAFSNAGFAVLQIDLLGCGDSFGEFADATWEAWINDVVTAYRCLEKIIPLKYTSIESVPLWLWGIRTGCLLACDASKHLNRSCSFIFWQPSISGKKDMAQFMRLKLTRNLMNGFKNEDVNESDAHCSDKNQVEVMGYPVSNELLQGISLSTLSPPAHLGCNEFMLWFELKQSSSGSLSPASLQCIKIWGDSGINTVSQLIDGPAFWSSNEIHHSPELIARTTQSLISSADNCSVVKH